MAVSHGYCLFPKAIPMTSQAHHLVKDARKSPQNLSHHFSKATWKRAPNVLKEYYRFLRTPGMGNFAGGGANEDLSTGALTNNVYRLTIRWKLSIRSSQHYCSRSEKPFR